MADDYDDDEFFSKSGVRAKCFEECFEIVFVVGGKGAKQMTCRWARESLIVGGNEGGEEEEFITYGTEAAVS